MCHWNKYSWSCSIIQGVLIWSIIALVKIILKKNPQSLKRDKKSSVLFLEWLGKNKGEQWWCSWRVGSCLMCCLTRLYIWWQQIFSCYSESQSPWDGKWLQEVSSPSPCSEQDHHWAQMGLLRALSSWMFKIYKGGGSRAATDKTFQWLIILIKKIIFLVFSPFSVYDYCPSLDIPPRKRVKSLALSSHWPLLRCWKAAVWSPPNVLDTSLKYFIKICILTNLCSPVSRKKVSVLLLPFCSSRSQDTFSLMILKVTWQCDTSRMWLLLSWLFISLKK